MAAKAHRHSPPARPPAASERCRRLERRNFTLLATHGEREKHPGRANRVPSKRRVSEAESFRHTFSGLGCRQLNSPRRLDQPGLGRCEEVGCEGVAPNLTIGRTSRRDSRWKYARENNKSAPGTEWYNQPHTFSLADYGWQITVRGIRDEGSGIRAQTVSHPSSFPKRYSIGAVL